MAVNLMNPKKNQLKSGPFRVSVNVRNSEGLMIEEFKQVDNNCFVERNPSSVKFEVNCDEILNSAPIRRYDCDNYETCLNLSASLDWDSFCCDGCDGCVNKDLVRRAKSAEGSEPVVSELISFASLAKRARRRQIQ